MFKPLALYLGLKYTRAHKKNQFVSFISLTSMLGIALGVMVLITVLSVMNGFDEEIHRRFFGMAPEITVSGTGGKAIEHWQDLSQKLKQLPGVKAIAPYVGSQGLMTFDGQVNPVVLTGILPDIEKTVTHMEDKLIAGHLDDLDHFGIILGRGLADSLGVMINDKVTIMIPTASVTPAGMIPRFKRFRVVGVFSAGPGFGFEARLAFINMHDAQTLLNMGEGVTGVKMKINNIYDAPKLSATINKGADGQYTADDWTEQFGAFFQAVKMEKTMMFMILMLIIAVAAFNLVSSLVMIVNDKQAEIAILRTLGATPRFILSVFMIQGLIVGVIGTGLGLLGGIVLASNATKIVNHLQSFFDVQLLSSSVYFVDFLPSKISWHDVWQVCGIALLMSFIATIYPAWRASRTVIAEALHYE